MTKSHSKVIPVNGLLETMRKFNLNEGMIIMYDDDNPTAFLEMSFLENT